MGFSDTGTYVRTNDPAAVHAALAPILARYSFRPAAEVPFEHHAPYVDLSEAEHLQAWMVQASDSFLRLYCSHCGLYHVHDGDFVPILQSLAAALKTDAFLIAVDDGDSICVLETDGRQSRLTGCHSYVLDEIYEETGGGDIAAPGEIHSFAGRPFPYQRLIVDAAIVPELIGYDFGRDMQVAISGFETAVFGRSLPEYCDFLDSEYEQYGETHFEPGLPREHLGAYARKP